MRVHEDPGIAQCRALGEVEVFSMPQTFGCVLWGRGCNFPGSGVLGLVHSDGEKSLDAVPGSKPLWLSL